MRKFIPIFFLIFISVIALAQDKNDTVSKNVKKWNKGIFFSAGINSIQYYSDAFFKDLFNKSFIITNAYKAPPNYPFYIDHIDPAKFNYTNSSQGPVLNIGLEFNSVNINKLNFYHILNVSYIRFSGKFSNSVHFTEHGSAGTEHWDADIIDTAKNKYSETLLSIEYKFQPTYRFVFFSLGMNATFIFIKNNQQKNEFVNGFFWGESMLESPFSSKDTYYYVNTLTYVNFPLQLGFGGYIRLNKIVLKPGFYLTTSFANDYRFFIVSVGVSYKNH
jgi:hypothetical protein